MPVTARATIQGALKLIGVLDPAETMTPEDSDDALLMLNDMVGAWNIERLNLYAITNVTASFSGVSATIGPGMTFNTPRPIRIESAYYRKGDIDYQLDIINDQVYNSISMKAISTDFPEVMHYDQASPTGNLFVYPVPSISTTYTLQVLTQLSAFADLDTAYNLPQGYAKALKYALAMELPALYKKEPPPSVVRNYITVMRSLKRANVDVPVLDVELPGNSAYESGSTSLLRILSGT